MKISFNLSSQAGGGSLWSVLHVTMVDIRGALDKRGNFCRFDYTAVANRDRLVCLTVVGNMSSSHERKLFETFVCKCNILRMRVYF